MVAEATELRLRWLPQLPRTTKLAARWIFTRVYGCGTILNIALRLRDLAAFAYDCAPPATGERIRGHTYWRTKDHTREKKGRGSVGSYISLAASHLKLTLDFCIGVRIRMPRKGFEQSLIPPWSRNNPDIVLMKRCIVLAEWHQIKSS